MRHIKNYFQLSLLGFMLIFSACTPSKEKLREKIIAAETALFSNNHQEFSFDTKQSYATIAAYQEFVDAFPDDTAAPEYLFKKADLYRSLKEGEKSIQTYNHILEQYPDYHKAAYCLFLKGFVLENEMMNIEKAKEAYQSFLEKYPQHDLAKDVQFSLQNLGKSPEEIINQFELELNEE